MNEAPKHRAFFGDGEHDFTLTPAMVLELEAVTGAGIGGLFRRMIANDFRAKEITETIRLGLIGGGEAPEIAARLVDTYVPATGLIESYSLALSILEALMSGKPAAEGGQ
jgi:hypothetical protein